MCQAYEGERRFVILSEQYEEREGFKAALCGESDSPPSAMFEDDWLHGYRCFQQRILPWGIGTLFADHNERNLAEMTFKQTGVVPRSVLDILGVAMEGK